MRTDFGDEQGLEEGGRWRGIASGTREKREREMRDEEERAHAGSSLPPIVRIALARLVDTRHKTAGPLVSSE
jgi:hypothetical protein